jgi:hypothetical protein
MKRNLGLNAARRGTRVASDQYGLPLDEQIRNRDPKGHETLCLDFAPVKDSRIGELAAKWDIVLGFSPEA